MTDLTETAFRNVLSLDQEIRPEQVEKFLDALNPKRNTSATPLFQVIRYQEAMQLLSCSGYIIKRLIQTGHLTRVYGSGNRFGIGITAESYHRFINNFTRRTTIVKKTPFYSRERKRRAEREQMIRKIRWSYHFTSQTTRLEKYQAIAKLLASNKNISRSTACLAAGVHINSFSSYLLSLTRPQSKQAQRLSRAAEIISRTIPLNKQPPSLRKLREMLVRHGINVGAASIGRILDELGYNRVKTI